MHAKKVTLKTSGPGNLRKDKDIVRLSILFIEGEEWWSAQCLEYDIAVQAKTMNDLFYEMERVLVSQIALDEELGRVPFEGIGRAPAQFWEAFERSQTRMERPVAGLKAGKSKRPRIQPTIKVADKAA
ncbi:MAG TPA: hypothetical protein VKB51_18405 [bacterium]|nr:hypothetical protein [bacterium]